MKLVRRIVLICLRHNILFKAKLIPGKQNVVGDKLFRLKFQEILADNSCKSHFNSSKFEHHSSKYAAFLPCIIHKGFLQAQLAPFSTVLQSGNFKQRFPVSETTLCNFIAWLFEQRYSPSSITSMASAISYVYKVFNLPDHSHNFLVRKILYGASKSAKLPDYRLPITYSILKKLVNALQFTVPNFFHRLLLHCIFTVAFHDFFRLGELIAKIPSNKPFIIQKQDVSIQGNSKVEIILRYSKTVQIAHPITISLSQSSQREICQVLSLQSYLLKSQTLIRATNCFNSILVLKYLITLLFITFKRL